jgi:hypothetical protein
VNGYHGQQTLMSDQGLWIAALGRDNRQGPAPDQASTWCENFNGTLFRNKDDGRVYLIGGDTDARIWEVTGLDTIRTGRVPLAITAADARLAAGASQRRRRADAPAAARPTLRLARGRAPDPGAGTAAALDAGGGRTARVALSHDDANLYAAFDVEDGSPMMNAAHDPALLFHGGDTCEVMLAAGGAGDVRLLFSVLDGRPVAVLFQRHLGPGQAPAPRRFQSPTGAEDFQRVEALAGAAVTVQRRAGGYRLEARVPLAAIPFAPGPPRVVHGDVGVLFSDASGTVTARRAYYYNAETSVVNDLPTEARLQPGQWGPIAVE